MAVAGETVSTTALADILGVTPDVVRKAVRDGKIASAGRGRFVLGEAVSQYCAQLRSVAAGWGDADERLELTVERARLVKAQREGQDMKNAEARGELARVSDVEIEWTDVLTVIRANMLTTSTRIAQRLSHLTPHDLVVIDEVVRDVLTRASEGEVPEGEVPDGGDESEDDPDAHTAETSAAA